MSYLQGNAIHIVLSQAIQQAFHLSPQPLQVFLFLWIFIQSIAPDMWWNILLSICLNIAITQ
jgi:hypothetical protein